MASCGRRNVRLINSIGNLLCQLPDETKKVITKIEKNSYKTNICSASSYLQSNMYQRGHTSMILLLLLLLLLLLWEECFCQAHRDTLYLSLLWLLRHFRERITGFLLFWVFLSLSRAFSRVDSFLLVQVKHRVFSFQRVFIIKIKRVCKGKEWAETYNNSKI